MAEDPQAPPPRRPPNALLQLLRGEARVLLSTRRRLDRDYRQAAGEGATDGQERQYVAGRRKVALWVLGWSIGGPALLAVAQHFLFPDANTAWAVARSALVFLVLVQLGLRLQTRFLPTLHRWVGAPPRTGGSPPPPSDAPPA